MGIFFFAPTAASRREAAGGSVRGAAPELFQLVVAGRAAAKSPVPVRERNSRRLTAFRDQRVLIQCPRGPPRSALQSLAIIRLFAFRASAEMPVENPFSRGSKGIPPGLACLGFQLPQWGN